MTESRRRWARSPPAGCCSGSQETLYVGDSGTDADAADAADVAFALYSGGYRKRPLDSFGECFVFHDFPALTRHIEARLAA